MIALVSQRQETNAYGEATDSLVHLITAFLADELGMAPVPVPNVPGAAKEVARSLDYGLLVLSGGGFVPQPFYLEPCEGGGSQPLRDDAERELVGHAIAAGVPVLGICRGMQVLNGLFGGKVKRLGSAFAPREDHPVRLADGRSIVVNSFHNNAVPLGYLAPGFEPLAVEEQAGTVEAFRSREKRILGLQWHPERPLHDAVARDYTMGLIRQLLAG